MQKSTMGSLHYAMINDVSRPMMFRIDPGSDERYTWTFQAGTHGYLQKMSVTADRPMYIHADGEIYSRFGTDVRKVSI